MGLITTYYNFKPAGCTDTDAIAFTTAAGITDTTQKDAICALVTALKLAGVWAKLRVFYPVVGGDATKHSFNLKNPALYQLTYVNAVTHSALGMSGDGTTSYAITGYNPVTDGQAHTNIGLGSYSQEATSTGAGVWCSIGAYNLAADIYNWNGVFVGKQLGSIASSIYLSAVNLTNGHTSVWRTGGNLQYVQGATVQSSLTAGVDYTDKGALANETIWISGANLSGTLYSASPHTLSCLYVCQYLNATEKTAFQNAIQAFQTSLGRNV